MPSSPAYARTRSSAIYYGCGSGFNVVDDGTRELRNNGLWGEVILTYNGSTGENCVVVRKIKFHNEKTHTGAGIKVQGDSAGWRVNSGYFYHWESITRYARGECVQYWGYMTTQESPDEERYATARDGRREWGNCGS